MKKELILYYVSRAILAALVGWIIASGLGLWFGVGAGALIFAWFIWIAHSGRYLVDPSRPLTPLRRDARGAAIRDRSLVLAVATGGVIYALAALLNRLVALPGNLGVWAVLVGALVYFGASNWHFFKR